MQLERLSSATTSIPRSASCAATTCATHFGQSASARGRRRSRRCASSRRSDSSPTSRTAPGRWRRASPTASSPSSSRTAIASASASTTTTSSCTQPFAIAPACRLPVGGYDFTDRPRRLQLRPAAAGLGQRLLFEHGSFYDGDARRSRSAGSRVNLTSQLSVEPSVSINWIDAADGLVHDEARRLARHLHDDAADVRQRARAVQLEHQQLSAPTLRLRWEYRPGSELFVVYNEERDTLAPNFPATRNRALIFKSIDSSDCSVATRSSTPATSCNKSRSRVRRNPRRDRKNPHSRRDFSSYSSETKPRDEACGLLRSHHVGRVTRRRIAR